MAGVVAFSGVAGCATAGAYPYNPDRLAEAPLGQIGHLCQAVIGVQPPEERYFVCIASLSDSMKNIDRGQALEQARRDCLSKGLGGPDLAVCIVRSADQEHASGPGLAMSGPMEEPGLSKTYPYASQRELHRREELSCARLGLDPAGGAFASCVGGLDSALFAADNPSQ
jgi:hypothetical protein